MTSYRRRLEALTRAQEVDATEAARKLAAKAGVDLAAVQRRKARGGRVTKFDVEAHIAAAKAMS